MKTVLKIVGGLAGLLLLVVLGLAGLVVATARTPDRPVSLQQVTAPDPDGASIPVTILYPTRDRPRLMLTGATAVRLSRDGAIDGDHLPVVVMSHGTGGAGSSHFDTALALAEAGYVVVLPTHPGDNYQDDSAVGTPRWIGGRARQIARVNDFILGQWSGRSHLDPQRLGLFGFSAGATTALVLLGGEPDMALVAAHCARTPELVCRLLRPGPAAVEAWTHDPRVKAAVVAAPGFGFALGPSGLASVTVPVQLWAGDADSNVPFASNTALVRDRLPASPEFHLVKGAAHFAFLPPCGWARPLLPPMICTDEKGFDRAAFHTTFNRQVVAFFDARL